MDKRKRWATKEAREYVDKAFNKGKMGLSFWAVCDYIGWIPEKVHGLKFFRDGLYADCLISKLPKIALTYNTCFAKIILVNKPITYTYQ